MPKIPENAKKPADHKVKPGPPDESFSFEYEGQTYTFAPTLGHLTPGFVRRNRSNEAEFQYGLIELLADEETLTVLDGMSLKQNLAVMRDFGRYVDQVIEVSLGE